MTDQTPTDLIRDEAVRVLAEALDPVGVLGGKPEFAAGIAMRHPTLAADLRFAVSWRLAVAALPEGWDIQMLWGTVTDERWGVSAGPFPSKAGDPFEVAGGPTPELALAALAAKLRETGR